MIIHQYDTNEIWTHGRKLGPGRHFAMRAPVPGLAPARLGLAPDRASPPAGTPWGAVAC